MSEIKGDEVIIVKFGYLVWLLTMCNLILHGTVELII